MSLGTWAQQCFIREWTVDVKFQNCSICLLNLDFQKYFIHISWLYICAFKIFHTYCTCIHKRPIHVLDSRYMISELFLPCFELWMCAFKNVYQKYLIHIILALSYTCFMKFSPDQNYLFRNIPDRFWTVDMWFEKKRHLWFEPYARCRLSGMFRSSRIFLLMFWTPNLCFYKCFIHFVDYRYVLLERRHPCFVL